MGNQQAWVEALNIRAENVNEWSASAPEGTPLLVWCLVEGHIQAHEYLMWASEHYGLPVLSSAFFESEPFLPQQFLNMTAQTEWQPWCFPVYQWENVTFVACTEPPANQDPQLRYVLADPRVLKEIWETHLGEQPSPSSLSEGPMGISLDSPPPFKLNLDENMEIAIPPVPEAKEEPTQIIQPSPVAIKRRQNQDEQSVEKVFSEIKNTYSHACILKCDGNVAHLYKWDDSLTPKAPDQVQLNQGFPSFIRIVSQTLLPYHGFLVDTPTHRDFFHSLGLEGLPGCITAVPLKHGDVLLGVLLAIGDENLQAIENMRVVEDAAENLMTAIGTSWLKAS